MSEQRCGTCKHWLPLAARKGEGMCQAIEWMSSRDKRKPIAYVQDAEDYAAGLYTRAEFGCVLWEAKP